MCHRLIASCVCICAWISAAPAAHAASVALPSARDNTLYESALGDISNGSGQYLFTGTTAFTTPRRGLIEFDVASSVPAGSTILNATLTLHMSRTAGAASPVSLHRALSDWGEGASVGFSEEGGGGPAEPGDATWVYTHYQTNTWTTPGGDFAPDASATAVIFGVDFYDWSSPDLVADLQSWLDSPSDNHGWLLLGDEEFNFTAKRFDTHENIDPVNRPVLTLEYQTAPEPGGFMLLAPALALTLTRPRRRRDRVLR